MSRLRIALVAVAALLSASAAQAAAPQAARIGDLATFPMLPSPLLPPGAPTVLICGKAAAVVGGIAQYSIPGPGGAPVPQIAQILTGSPSVLIGGHSAARVGDQVGPGRIIQGCPTVLIGP